VIIIGTSVLLSGLNIPNVYSTRNTGSATPTSVSSSCITYNSKVRTITIACGSASLTDIYNHLNDNSVLSRESVVGGGGASIWFLGANIVIARGATLHINSADTKWLKITSTPTFAFTSIPNSIDVHGSLKIDSVKVTSWDPTTNYYAISNGSRRDVGSIRDLTVPGTPRPFITVEKDATGTTDITNSEIAYLGYEKGSFSGIGTAGLNYYGGEGSILRGNNIHDLYFGFYSSGVAGMVIENNQIYHNAIYGLDPHTGTHDLVIRNNVVHDNGQFGIICSLNCNNITIENNRVYHDGDKNTGAGIMFSRNTVNSIAINNNVLDESAGISISGSDNNQISNNTVSNSGDGIDLKNSSNNRIHDNTIMNSTNGIDTSAAIGTGNIIYNNHFINSTSSHSTSSNNKITTSGQPHGKLKHHHKQFL
jgi:mannuronan 5-epimerase